MKQLFLKITSYNHLEQGFKEWLDILGYNPATVYNIPNIAREFLHFLEQKHIYSITEVQPKDIKNYHNYIRSRENQRRGGGLSNNYINKHIQALEKFLEYLSHKGMTNVSSVNIRRLPLFTSDIAILTVEEIKELFTVQINPLNTIQQQAIHARDKAMLCVYYSLGLRSNEGAHLMVNDFDFDRRLLHVKKGKNYQQRLVPFSKNTAKLLEDYVYNHRLSLVKTKKESAFFIGQTGKPMTGTGLYWRFKLMQVGVDNPILQSKNIGLHALRHSIATHLLQAGMELQKIQKFLGHSSLESTQIYTHLIEND